MRFIFCLLVMASLAVPAEAQSFDRTIHVDIGHSAASDSNPGTAALPLRTIQEAMTRARANKKAYLSTHVVIGPGEYRESVTFSFTNHPTSQPDNATPVLVEGAGSQQTIISGSEIYGGWSHVGGGVYSHVWTEDWGVSEDPTGGKIAMPQIVLRREMVFVDGVRMKQVLSPAELVEGTFRVDEAGDRMYLYPPRNTSVTNARIEVAVRETGWDTMFEHNLTLRGIAVRHFATPWQNGAGALRLVVADNTVLEDVVVRENNFIGLYLQQSSGISLQTVRANHNGHSGWGFNKIKSLAGRETETSYNNWRGLLGGHINWDPGNKSYSVHGMVLEHHTSLGNASRGLWLDTDHADILLVNVDLRDNLRDGIFIEANQGPVTLRGGTISDNGEYGVLTASSKGVTLDGVSIASNAHGGILVSGMDEGRDVTDFETGITSRIRSGNWSIINSTINDVEGGTGQFLLGTTYGLPAWNDFVSTLESDRNVWWDPRSTKVFDWYGDERIDLTEWQRRTGQDVQSLFHSSSRSVPTSAEGVPEAQGFSLTAPYPNPFNATASLTLTVPRPQHVRVALFDLLGREVAVVYDGYVGAGSPQELVLDGSFLPSGRYLCRAVGDGLSESRTVVIAR